MGANAQTSVPAFVTGQVLTAQQQTEINTGIPVFADSTARDAAFGGTGEKVLAEGQFAFLEDTNATQFYDGSTWQPLAPTREFALFNETQAGNTAGGTATPGSWFKRVLNTTVQNNITGCSIASSVITLPAGSYTATVFAPNYRTDESQFRIQNTSDAATLIYGMSGNSRNAASQTMTGTVQGYFTLAASKTIEVQNRVLTTIATFGLGLPTNFGDEVYASILIEKVG